MNQKTALPAKITPMFEQYLAIKAEYTDALLFYRMGDFYELFFDDAEVAARALQITLTSRNSSAENPIPMCGVPHHSAETYVNQLLEKGYHVAICEQVEDPKAAKGLVKREVVLVRTPGTAVEDSSLSAKAHNYLGALYWDKEKNAGGFAWLDYSTGEWTGLFSKKETDLWQWVQKMQPKELLLPDFPKDIFDIPKSISLGSCTPIRLPVRTFFDATSAQKRLLKAQGIQELGALGLQNKTALVQACGALLVYLEQTQKQAPDILSPFQPMDLSKHLILDEITERNLEIFRRLDGKKGPGTLWNCLDETITSMGGRLLEERLRHPWKELANITRNQEVVTFFFSHTHKRAALREALAHVYDLERLSTRIALNRATPKDFIALRASLHSLTKVEVALQTPVPGQYATADDEKGVFFPPLMQTMLPRWDNLSDATELLTKALADPPPLTVTEGKLFKLGFNAELDEILHLLEHGESRLQELLQKEQKQSNLPKLKLGYNRVFGYYFELSKGQIAQAPEHFIRKQTLANAERYITPAMKELEEKIFDADEKRNQLEYTLFQELKKYITALRPRILFMAGVLAALDFWQSLAETAHKKKWVCPTVHDGYEIRIHEGRHPVVEAMAGPAGFIPNDLYIDEQRRLILITGPNMAGKSTILRQAAIITLLAQMGSFVPASKAHLGLCDRIFSRVGASDNLAQGQSTFMVEMMETARILRQATRRSLVILDEIGRGTSTFDGLSLAWAVVEDLLRRSDGGIRTLFATHYHELTALEGRLPGLHNMNVAMQEYDGEILFLRRLVPGPTDRSYGIEVARLAGVPQPVVNRAKKILRLLEASQKGKPCTHTTMQQLLPGLELPGESEKPEYEEGLLPPIVADVAPPVMTALQNLDVDILTPMQALTLLHEWKTLWGKSS